MRESTGNTNCQIMPFFCLTLREAMKTTLTWDSDCSFMSVYSCITTEKCLLRNDPIIKCSMKPRRPRPMTMLLRKNYLSRGKSSS